MVDEVKPILEVQHVTKRFPGVVALDDVSTAFLPGEVHAVVGENGAGKSTLMKIMAGAYRPDEGTIIFQGEPVTFSHPREAQNSGISIIYQEFNLLPDRNVAQNIFFAREPSKRGLVDRRELNRKTIEVLKQLDAEDIISPQAMLHTLPVAQQQIVEIAKAIAFDSKVLIMDEPTAALSMNEVQMLTNLIKKLQARGMAIIFISHRIIEVFDIAQRITVLKDGQKVGSALVSETTPNEIIEMMVGRQLDQFFPDRALPEAVGDVKLRVNNASNGFLKDVSLELRAGEIVGVSGLQGSGRTELAQALFGVEPFKSGRMEVNGRPMDIRSPAQAIHQGMGYVTEDRKAEGIFPNQPLRDNVLITIRTLLKLFSRVLPLGVQQNPELVPGLVEQVDVRTPSFEQEVQYLSGGNQQKVVLGKWLASTADVFIFDEPTRGIDIEAKSSIHDMIRNLANQGAAVLMISSELPEIIGMSDRIIVMYDGQVAGELPANSSESEIMMLATGHTNGKNGGYTNGDI